MFSCEFCEISKNTFFTEHIRTTASGMGKRKRIVLKKAAYETCETMKLVLTLRGFSKGINLLLLLL